MKLSLTVGRETTSEERTYIQKTFDQHFDVQISDGLYRLSEQQLLPLVIHLFADSALSGAAWDSLKFAIHNLFGNIQSATQRKTELIIKTRDKKAVITNDRQILIEEEKSVEISNVDELLKILEKANLQNKK